MLFEKSLQANAVCGCQEEADYPILEPLPSYGEGRDGGKRFASLIFGTNLTDVVITGKLLTSLRYM